MDNRIIEEAKRFHEITKRTAGDDQKARQRKSPEAKVYVGAAVSPLEQNVPMPGTATLDALANTEFDEELEVDLTRLSQILGAAASFIRQGRSERGTCPTEVYLVSSEVPGLRTGIYHLDPDAFALNQLREGDHRPDLVATAGDNQSLAAAPTTLILSAALTASYRRILSDTGRILARILAAASAAQLASSVEMSFVDVLVNRLLGLDGRSEAALCLIPLGRSLDWAEHVGERALPAVKVKTTPRDLDGSLDLHAGKIHSASSLLSNEETRPLRGPCPRPLPENRVDTRLDPSTKTSRPLSEVLQEETNRDCTGKSMDLSQLSALLHHATVDLPADFLEGPETSLLDLYLVVHRVTGLGPGLYTFRPGTSGLTREHAGALGAALEKSLARSSVGHDAAAHLILVSDLDPILERFGNRGYRLAQVEAGVTAGRLGLAAQSIGLGAPVLDFFDDEMSRFLSPYANGKAMILALGLG